MISDGRVVQLAHDLVELGRQTGTLFYVLAVDAQQPAGSPKGFNTGIPPDVVVRRTRALVQIEEVLAAGSVVVVRGKVGAEES